MPSSSDRVLLSGSGSKRCGDSGSSRDDTSDREEMGSIGRIPMERVRGNGDNGSSRDDTSDIVSTTSTVSRPLTTRT